MALKVKKRYTVGLRGGQYYKLPQRTLKREQRKNTIRRGITAFLLISVVCVGGASGYTFYTGKHQPVLGSQSTPTRSVRPIIKSQKIASDAPIGSAVQTVTPEVKPGDNAALTIRTNPDADCLITVKYNNIVAVDSGLVAKKADEFGLASWSWTIPAATPEGLWPVEVLCKNKKNSTMVRADLNVTNKLSN